MPGPATPEPEPDVALGRRRFFRAFVADAVRTAASFAGVAGALQRSSAEMAGALLAASPDQVVTEPPAAAPGAAGTPGAAQHAAPAAGPRATLAAPVPYRLDAAAIVLLDQRRLPDEFVEVACPTAPDVRVAIREGVVRGAPLLGQVVAGAVALAAAGVTDAKPFARRATITATANSLRTASGSAAPVRRALERMLAVLDRRRDLHEDGHGMAAALRAEAEAIADDAARDHERLAEHGFGIFGDAPEDASGALRILTLGSVGVLAGGRVGTVLAVVDRLVTAARAVEVVVCETRPSLAGTRLTAWELSRAGIPCEVIPDAGAAALMAAGEIDIVLVGAEAIAASGDVLAEAGTCALALLAARNAIPFAVVAPAVSIDLDTPEGRSFHVEPRADGEVLSFLGRRVAPPAVLGRNPALDVTPEDLVGALVTEDGVFERPLAPVVVRLGLAVRQRGAV
jgi:methylthioribose-1-phosphate isomerase